MCKMKKTVLWIVSTIVSCFFMASCGDEWEKYERVELEADGVALSPTGATSYYGELGASGGEVTLTAKGKNRENGFLSQVEVDGDVYEVTGVDLKQPLPYTVYEGEWGRIEILSGNPHTTRMTLQKNESGHSMKYRLKFGGGYWTSDVILVQPRP